MIIVIALWLQFARAEVTAHTPSQEQAIRTSDHALTPADRELLAKMIRNSNCKYQMRKRYVDDAGSPAQPDVRRRKIEALDCPGERGKEKLDNFYQGEVTCSSPVMGQIQISVLCFGKGNRLPDAKTCATQTPLDRYYKDSRVAEQAIRGGSDALPIFTVDRMNSSLDARARELSRLEGQFPHIQPAAAPVEIATAPMTMEQMEGWRQNRRDEFAMKVQAEWFAKHAACNGDVSCRMRTLQAELDWWRLQREHVEGKR